MPRLSIAPMVDCTDRHFRWAIRQLAPTTFLYTEMISAPSLIFGDAHRFLDYDSAEHPVGLQLASDKPEDLERTTALAVEYGYDEVNLNCGCPSDKIQNANYGACLMAQPKLVNRLVRAMVRQAKTTPVTVKHRIGIKGRESYEHLREFASAVMDAGASRLIIHARIAILEGLSPKENRTIPPLRYHDVERLKSEFPNWTIDINGGITNLETIQQFSTIFDGVMVGRAAYEDPYFMADAERLIFGGAPAPTRAEFLKRLVDYFLPWEEQGLHWRHLLRHFPGLFHGLKGSRQWRHLISPPYAQGSIQHIISQALSLIPSESLQSATSLAPVLKSS